MKFPFRRYGRSVLRPVIPIHLKYGTKGLLYGALVDSGADVCLFDRQIGEALGIDVGKGERYEVLGIGGGSAVYRMHEVTLIVAEQKCKVSVGFDENESDTESHYGIIGQKGLFDRFRVSFDLLGNEIELRPYP